ncbi:hypothetical protein [Paenibacillus piri]|uniref:Uncharacterized protein n=1 Tax=Paenibacillus piri TaxID=2547395 RepID=A0A4R5K8V0_9BACL|nr:hypothetical protein [Paenibacillus piri]TDF91242.1 hypothetical protein E1757_33230 [Paenibacillus piri]
MSRGIQSYFHTENEAEDVRVLLAKYDTDMLEVGIRDDGTRRNGRTLIFPLAADITPNGTGATMAGATAAVTDNGAGLAPLLGADDLDGGSDEWDRLHYVLSVRVNDSDYEEVVHLIRRNGGYVARPD